MIELCSNGLDPSFFNVHSELSIHPFIIPTNLLWRSIYIQPIVLWYLLPISIIWIFPYLGSNHEKNIPYHMKIYDLHLNILYYTFKTVYRYMMYCSKNLNMMPLFCLARMIDSKTISAQQARLYQFTYKTINVVASIHS